MGNYLIIVVLTTLMYVLLVWSLGRKKTKEKKMRYTEMAIADGLLFLVSPFMFKSVISLEEIAFLGLLSVIINIIIGLINVIVDVKKQEESHIY